MLYISLCNFLVKYIKIKQTVLKHIKSYFEKINESVRPGSVILIKGAPENGKTKIFAAHVKGVHEIKEGAQMLFLSDDFYRIKKEGDQYKSVKISYKSDESLKKVLNLKTPGKISIVKNNNKTPLHWKTLKSMTVSSALSDITGELEDSKYLLESVEVDTVDRDQLWKEYYNLVAQKALNTVFLNDRQLEILDYNILRDSHYNTFLIELTVFDKTGDLDKFADAFDEPLNPIDVSITVAYRLTEVTEDMYDFEIQDILVGNGDADHDSSLEKDIDYVNISLADARLDNNLSSYIKDTILLPVYKRREF